jgi:hypothetical protein
MMTSHHVNLYPEIKSENQISFERCSHMNEMHETLNRTYRSTAKQYQPGYYEIRVKGHLADRWADWFGELTITLEDDGNTLLSGSVVDQAALHGLLRKVRDLSLPLLSVMRVESN